MIVVFQRKQHKSFKQSSTTRVDRIIIVSRGRTHAAQFTPFDYPKGSRTVRWTMKNVSTNRSIMMKGVRNCNSADIRAWGGRMIDPNHLKSPVPRNDIKRERFNKHDNVRF